MVEQAYAKPFEVRDNTTIRFGKFKGQPHSIFKDAENKPYVEWILNTEEGFAEPTKIYLRQFMDEP